MKAESIKFEVDGQTLRGNIYLADSPKNLAVLFVHGWTGKPNDDAAKLLAEQGYSAMTFSLSGHNNSDGKLEDQTRQKSLKEVVAAYDFFKSRLSDDKKIAVAGNSYGGYMATLLSGERPVAALQLRVPANYRDEGFTELQLPQSPTFGNVELREWRCEKLDSNATKSLRALHDFRGPVQLLEAELDDTVPHQTVQNYIGAVSNKAALEYHLLKDWPHSMGTDKKRNRQYQELLLNWLDKISKRI